MHLWSMVFDVGLHKNVRLPGISGYRCKISVVNAAYH